ncbi:MAG: peptidoglycan DD-metalloendopeptidase family protein [Syntrophorhabdaceae bacterium]|nr:peptidoglycan DD-metalloendopeptidase family protein [Syntrophorhabdaceae bacterium]
MPKKTYKNIFKRILQSITIMVIPHNSKKPINIKMPYLVVMLLIFLLGAGTSYLLTRTVDYTEYGRLKKKLNAYNQEFKELEGTINKLKDSEAELKKLLAFKSKEEIIENFNPNNDGDIDFIDLKKQAARSIESLEGIKKYLANQKDVYKSTPIGLPVSGNVTSYFGNRIHPVDGKARMHNGIDVTAKSGTPVKATADGFVSFSGSFGAYGNVVVIEHGLGFSTLYSHNEKNVVTVGQKVKRGDIIAYVGSTGNAQSPHVHYSVFKDGRPLDPLKVFRGER